MINDIITMRKVISNILEYINVNNTTTLIFPSTHQNSHSSKPPQTVYDKPE